MHEYDDQIGHHMERVAEAFSKDPAPSAASMWWRLSLRARNEKAHRAQQPLLWMTRIAYVTIATLMASAIASQPYFGPALAVGLAALAATAIPILITLLVWSRSGK